MSTLCDPKMRVCNVKQGVKVIQFHVHEANLKTNSNHKKTKNSPINLIHQPTKQSLHVGLLFFLSDCLLTVLPPTLNSFCN